VPADLIFLIVTAIVGALLVLGASLAAVRERSAARFAVEAGAGNGQGKYEPDAEIAEAHAGASASASVGVVRVLWWITIAAVLVGVGLSDAYRANQALIFGLGGVAVVVVVVLHELMPRTWRNDLTTAAEVAIAVALSTGLLLLTGYGASPYVFTLDLVAVAVALGRGGWAAVAVALLASGVYLGVIAVDPAPDRFAGTSFLRIILNVGAIWLLAFLAGVFSAHERRVRSMLSDLSRIDPLTGLFNRGQLYPTLEQEVRRTRRSERGFSVLMVDVDGLKAVNDGLGHQRGDEVLRALGRSIRGSIRTVDSAYRYGGDEFLVLLPETDYSGAFVVAEKIRGEAEEMGFRLEAEGTSTSVSIGLVSHPEDGGTADELVRAADRAMYNAKSLGKNQISGYPRPPRLAGPVAVAAPEEREEPESGSSGATVSVPIGEPIASPSAAAASAVAESTVAPSALAASAAETPAASSAASAVVEEPAPEPVAAEAPEHPGDDHEPDARWTAVPDLRPRRISLAIAEQSEEEEPDAAEVRRQIAVATRSFDPDHQIRRAMDAFLSPPGGGERRPD
jgi:diguanylate cyclase (GGDEF)-like protein